ncbi:hypothetical protein HYH03_005429 [Edaphochlamys debaryana]|uniref:Uncharacterized protein n=1 Tax=Edaphochlamys debaryana TaxID=47281 RepID=A0A835Y5Y0_9CHLO|nr:hypothetical protein HYH03_005429 [Edaphochlamys debaryana]|eukprot:KAG2496608.1 hypothetical protein HYH03_005429 [Edaphochlamys debaryana]
MSSVRRRGVAAAHNNDNSARTSLGACSSAGPSKGGGSGKGLAGLEGAPTEPPRALQQHLKAALARQASSSAPWDAAAWLLEIFLLIVATLAHDMGVAAGCEPGADACPDCGPRFGREGPTLAAFPCGAGGAAKAFYVLRRLPAFVLHTIARCDLSPILYSSVLLLAGALYVVRILHPLPPRQIRPSAYVRRRHALVAASRLAMALGNTAAVLLAPIGCLAGTTALYYVPPTAVPLLGLSAGLHLSAGSGDRPSGDAGGGGRPGLLSPNVGLAYVACKAAVWGRVPLRLHLVVGLLEWANGVAVGAAVAQRLGGRPALAAALHPAVLALQAAAYGLLPLVFVAAVEGSQRALYRRNHMRRSQGSRTPDYSTAGPERASKVASPSAHVSHAPAGPAPPPAAPAESRAYPTSPPALPPPRRMCLARLRPLPLRLRREGPAPRPAQGQDLGVVTATAPRRRALPAYCPLTASAAVLDHGQRNGTDPFPAAAARLTAALATAAAATAAARGGPSAAAAAAARDPQPVIRAAVVRGCVHLLGVLVSLAPPPSMSASAEEAEPEVAGGAAGPAVRMAHVEVPTLAAAPDGGDAAEAEHVRALLLETMAASGGGGAAATADGTADGISAGGAASFTLLPVAVPVATSPDWLDVEVLRWGRSVAAGSGGGGSGGGDGGGGPRVRVVAVAPGGGVAADEVVELTAPVAEEEGEEEQAEAEAALRREWVVSGRLRLPAPDRPGAYYLHILPTPAAAAAEVSNGSTANGSGGGACSSPLSASASAAAAARAAAGGPHAPLAVLPLLALPSAEAAAELGALFETMVYDTLMLYDTTTTAAAAPADSSDDVSSGGSVAVAAATAAAAHAAAFAGTFAGLASDLAFLIACCLPYAPTHTTATAPAAGAAAGISAGAAAGPAGASQSDVARLASGLLSYLDECGLTACAADVRGLLAGRWPALVSAAAEAGAAGVADAAARAEAEVFLP